MLKFERSITINAPVKEVFAYATKPEHLPEYWFGITKVMDVKRLPHKGFAYKFLYERFGMRFDVTAEDLEFVHDERIVVKTFTEGAERRMAVTFESLPGGKTRLHSIIEYTIPEILRAKLEEPFIKKLIEEEFEVSADTLKARIELGVPTAVAR